MQRREHFGMQIDCTSNSRNKLIYFIFINKDRYKFHFEYITIFIEMFFKDFW